MDFIDNYHGGKNLTYNNYMFILKNRKSEKNYWKCIDCNVYIHTVNDRIVKVNNQHQHQWDHSEQIIRMKISSKAKQSIDKTPNESVNQIFHKVSLFINMLNIIN